MKILVFVDVHGSVNTLKKIIKKSAKADLLICAGDLSNWGQKLDYLLSLLSKTKKLLLIIPGNHETSKEIKKSCSLFDFAQDLHKASYSLNNYTFFGYGSGGFTLSDPKFERIAKKFKKTIKKDSKIILITHAPPYKTSLDKLPIGHRGCKSIRKFIEDVQPKLVICGHLHENAGNEDKIKKTLIINPGKDGKIIEI